MRHGSWRSFYRHQLLIPPWWTLAQESSLLLRFERSDTHYDWVARFERRPCDPSHTAQDIAQQECTRLKVEFDPDRLQEIADARFIADAKCRKQLAQHSLRLEGTAKQFQTERCHLDLFVIKRPQCSHCYMFSSWSSVLSGLIEGPYFDQVLKNLKLTETA